MGGGRPARRYGAVTEGSRPRALVEVALVVMMLLLVVAVLVAVVVGWLSS